jgi:hypothetical protein
VKNYKNLRKRANEGDQQAEGLMDRHNAKKNVNIGKACIKE